jgi:AraC-like DNA-binding protein
MMVEIDADRTAGLRHDWIVSIADGCLRLTQAMGRHDGADALETLVAAMPPPCGALEVLVGRCMLARTLLDEHRRHAKSRRDRAVRRRLVDYCLGSCRSSPADGNWLDAAKLLSLARAVSSDAKQPIDEAAVARQIRRVVEGTFNEHLTALRLASAVGATLAEASRAFERTYGQNLREFVSDLRYAHARQLLLTTDLKISAVASEVGFRSPKDLYRLVKARSGLTPARLRRTFSLD